MKIIHSSSLSPAVNLATEEFLFYESEDDMLFFYVNLPSVIIGSNQVVQNEVNIDFCRKYNIEIIRRMSGGGAVYHDTGNLNYSFITNRKQDQSALSDEFLHPVVEVLKELNVPVVIGTRKDLWLSGSKVSGTASHVSKNRELHHGTLLFDASLENLHRALNAINTDLSVKGTASVSSQVMNISEYLRMNKSSLDMNTFRQKFISACECRFTSKSEPFFLNENINKLVLEKYQTQEWNFKK
ncbi:MAG: biotin/lipoate A/B protein ligase family protein [Paludibacter sp.]|nr:biotin/lipoate A/B protein ligase family protein [Paludibacter sp.]